MKVKECGQGCLIATSGCRAGSDLLSFCYTVCTCSAATKALDQLRDKSHNFDLVLSDVYMPGEQQQAANGAVDQLRLSAA